MQEITKATLYLAFIDLTKAFAMVNRTGLFKLLEKIGCPPKLLSIIASLHVNIMALLALIEKYLNPSRLTLE